VWGLNSQSQDQEPHAPLTEPARHPDSKRHFNWLSLNIPEKESKTIMASILLNTLSASHAVSSLILTTTAIIWVLPLTPFTVEKIEAERSNLIYQRLSS